MGRPPRWERGSIGILSLAWVIGTWLGVHYDPGHPCLMILAASAICIVVLLVNAAQGALHTWLIGAVLILMSMAWSNIDTRRIDADEFRFLSACDGRITELTGTVMSIHRKDHRRTGVLEGYGRHGRSRCMTLDDVEFDGTASAGLESPGEIDVYVTMDPHDILPWGIGDVVKARGRLCGARPPSNPGSRLTHYRTAWFDVPTPTLIRTLDRPNRSFWSFVYGVHDSWKNLVVERLNSILSPWGGGSAFDLVSAMTLGRRSSGYEDMANAYRRTGTAHYLAVSGFAFGVLSAVQLFVTSGLSRVVRMPLLILGSLLAILCMDARTPAMRAVTIIVISSLGSSLGREWSRSSTLGMSAVLILTVSPREVINPGFHLSFVVVAGLMKLSSGFERSLPIRGNRDDGTMGSLLVEFTRKAVACGVVAWLLSTPILLHHFGSLSTIGCACSITAAPLVACLIGASIIGLILSLAWEPMGHLFGAPCAWSAMVLDNAVGFAAMIPGSFVITHKPSLSWTICCVSGLFWCLSRRVRRLHASMACIVVFATWFALEFSLIDSESPDRLVTLDVGDGSCHLFQHGSECVMVDCGSMSQTLLASKTILPAMEDLGITTIKVLFLTHPNLDHYAAVSELVDRVQIDRVCIGESFIRSAESDPEGPESRLIRIIGDRRIDLQIVSSGWERPVKRVVGSPPPKAYRAENDSSLVIRVRPQNSPIDERSMILFTGDIEERGMRDLIESHQDRLPTHVLEAPHHGSVRPSTKNFIESSSPSIIVQSTGPRRMVLDRFGSMVDPMSRHVTARDGAIEIRFDGSEPVGLVTHRHRDR